MSVHEMKDRLVRHEDAILTATMNIRYALDAYATPVSPHDVAALRRSAAAFIELAGKIQAQQEKDETAETLRES
jgi:hypothetical protein